MVVFFFVVVHLIFFFKQQTAYELRISDWSSDVCSSDLRRLDAVGEKVLAGERLDRDRRNRRDVVGGDRVAQDRERPGAADVANRTGRLAGVGDRKSGG